MPKVRIPDFSHPLVDELLDIQRTNSLRRNMLQHLMNILCIITQMKAILSQPLTRVIKQLDLGTPPNVFMVAVEDDGVATETNG